MTQLVFLTNPGNTTIQFDSRQSMKNGGWTLIFKWVIAVIIFGHIFPPRVQAVPISRDDLEKMFALEQQFDNVPGMIF